MHQKVYAKTYLFLRIIIGLLIIGISSNCYSKAPLTASEIGAPFITNYSQEEYGGGSRVWRVQIDSKGVLYFAADDIIEFDGESWKSHLVPVDRILTIKIDESDNIWIGGVNDFGCLRLNDDGSRTYEDFMPRLPDTINNIGNVWEIGIMEDATYVICDNMVLAWDGNRFNIWDDLNKGARLLPQFVGDEIFLHSKGGSLLRKINNNFETILSPDKFPSQDSALMFMHDLGEGVFLAGFLRQGLYTLDTNAVDKKFTPYGQLQDDYTFSTAVLKADHFVVAGSLMNGLYIINSHNQYIYNISKNDGLGDSSILDLAIDKNGKIWAATANGIASFYLPQDISYFGNQHGLDGRVHSAIRFKDHLMFGTYQGLAKVSQNDTGTPNATLYDSVNMPCYDMLISGEKLIFTDPHKIYLLDEISDEPVMVDAGTKFIYRLYASVNDENQFYKVNDTGLVLYETENNSLKKITETTFEYKQTSIVELENGTLWQGTESADFVYEINFHDLIGKDFQHATFTKKQFPKIRDEAVTWSKAYSLGNQPLFLTNLGIFTYEYEKFAYLENLNMNLSDNSYNTIAAIEDENNLWISFKSIENSELGNHNKSTKKNSYSYKFGRVSLGKDSEIIWQPIEIPGLEKVGDIYNIYYEKDNDEDVLWIMGSKTVIRISPNAFQNKIKSKTVLIRSATTDNEQKQLTIGNGTSVTLDKQLKYPITSLRFEFAAPDYQSGNLEYRTKLEGLDDNWTRYSKLNFVNYNNLAEGDYKLHVQARNTNKEESLISTYELSILPPFYRTKLAYISYIFLGLSLTAVFTYWWTRRLRSQNEKLEEVVKQRTEELRYANEAEKRLLSKVSHDTKNPLHTIIGLSSFLINRKADGDDKVKMRQLNQAAVHLLELQENFLEVAAIEAGKIVLRPEPFCVNDLLDEIRDINYHLATSKDLYINYSPTENSPILFADWKRIKQALMNFVSNAIKFTNEGGITLSVEVNNSEDGKVFVVFNVSDTGTGIKDEDKERIFESFTQLKNQEASQQKGTGLGLAISKEIVALMNGEIKVASEYGKGTTFSICLNLEIASESQKSQLYRDEDSLPYRFPGKRILVVDDHDVNCALAQKSLEEAECIVDVANNGSKALELLKSENYDLVFMDNEMPKMSGLEATKHYRQIEKASIPLPIIGMTGSVKKVQCFLDAGMTDHIAKPFQPPHLYQILDKYLQADNGPSETINLAFLNILCAKDGDHEKLDPIKLNQKIEEFNAKIETHLLEIEKAINTADAKLLETESHKASSLVKIYGAQLIPSTLLSIEENAKRGDIECCRDIFPRLKKRIAAFNAQLNALKTDNSEQLDMIEFRYESEKVKQVS